MMQAPNLNVYRGSSLIGVLDMSANDMFYGFSYAESYLRARDAVPLSASLPLSPMRYEGAQALPFFEGLLPEGDARLVVAKQFHASASSPAQLICVLGRDCAGDVMVVAEDDPVQPPARAAYALLPRGLADLARNPLKEVAELRAEYRLSLAGAQEKVALYHDDRASLEDGWYAPMAGSPSSHIVKPQVSDRFPSLATNEYLCMAAAAHLGIRVAEVSLLFPDHPLLLVKRFDRASSEERNPEGLRVLGRTHQEDLCQALGLNSSLKYEGERTAYLPRVVDLIVAYAEQPPEALRELHRLMLFNYVIGNCDAHLKNFSLIWEGPTSVRLAPAYDLVSTAVYDGRFGARLSRSMGLRMGSHLNIDKVDADDVALLARLLRQPSNAARVERERLCEGLQAAFSQAVEDAVQFGFGKQAGELAERILFGAKVRMKALE